MRLGWAHGDQEIFSRDEMTRLFDLGDVNQSASTFNPQKLLWLNQQYLKSIDAEEIAQRLRYYLEQAGIDPATGPHLADLVRAQRERSTTLVELVESSRFLFQDFAEWDHKARRKHLGAAAAEPLRAVRAGLADLEDPGGWAAGEIHAVIAGAAEARLTETGRLPPLFRGYRRLTRLYRDRLRRAGWNPFDAGINAPTAGRAFSVLKVRLGM